MSAPTFTLKEFAEAFGSNRSSGKADDDPVTFAMNVIDDATRSLAVLYTMLWREATAEDNDDALPLHDAANFTINVKQRLDAGVSVLVKLRRGAAS